MPKAADTPDLADVIREHILGAVACIETQLPARIVSYDRATQRASVKPLIKGVFIGDDGQREFYEHPVIPGVPVAFHQAAGVSITFDLEPGDRGIVLFASRDISGWLENDSDINEPQDPRRHNINDAIFLPGLSSFANALDGTAIESGVLVVKAPAIKLGSTGAVDFVVLSIPNDANWSSLATAFSTWVPVAGDGGAALKTLLTTLIGTGWPAATPATKVKAE